MITIDKMIELVNGTALNNKVLYEGKHIEDFISQIYQNRDLNMLEPIYKEYYKLLDTGYFKVVINDTIFKYDLVLRYDIIILDRIPMPNTDGLSLWLSENKDQYRHIMIVTNEKDEYLEEYFIKEGFRVVNKEDNIIAIK